MSSTAQETQQQREPPKNIAGTWAIWTDLYDILKAFLFTYVVASVYLYFLVEPVTFAYWEELTTVRVFSTHGNILVLPLTCTLSFGKGLYLGPRLFGESHEYENCDKAREAIAFMQNENKWTILVDIGGFLAVDMDAKPQGNWAMNFFRDRILWDRRERYSLPCNEHVVSVEDYLQTVSYHMRNEDQKRKEAYEKSLDCRNRWGILSQYNILPIPDLQLEITDEA